MSIGGRFQSSESRRSRWLSLFALFSMALVGIATSDSALPEYKPDVKHLPPVDEDQINYLARIRNIIELFRDQPEMVEQWNNAVHNSALEGQDVYVPFDCPPQEPSPTPPVTAHTVRPADIKVIGALGDSITAANGVHANTPLQTFVITNRGESWSIGGERTLEDRILTLPNILRKFNPDIIGASDCRRSSDNELSGLNVAIPGSTNRGMESQAVEVMTRMLEDPNIDYFNDWKLITIFIGGNDLCQYCNFNDSFSAESYYNGVKAALDKLYLHLPRAIVNLQPMFDVSIVKDLLHPGSEALCQTLHKITCPCNELYAEEQRALQLEYFNKMVELTDGRYDGRLDFTVVLQPHLKDLVPWKFPNGSYDMSFVAPDCFHPSHKAHQAFAFMLWNTMLTPTWAKTTNYTIGEDEELFYMCPTEERPYIYTNLNSGPPNACWNGPCLNAGTCINEGSSYRCNCSPYYTGSRCEIAIPPNCGDIMRQANAADLPSGWSLGCYIGEGDEIYWNTPCFGLLQGLSYFGSYDQLLAAGGNFGCWTTNNPQSPDVYNACADNYQQDIFIRECESCNFMAVCIRFP